MHSRKELVLAVGLGIVISVIPIPQCSLFGEFGGSRSFSLPHGSTSSLCPRGSVLVEGANSRLVCFDSFNSEDLDIGGKIEINFRK